MSAKQPFVSVREAAQALGVSQRALYEWLRWKRDGTPEIPHVRLGRRVLIRRSWLDQVIGEELPR